MLDQWFCEIAGREIGPLSPEQIRTMAAKGQILPSDCVRQGTQGAWVPAQQVKGLFAPAPVMPRPAQPQAESRPVVRRAPEPPVVAQPPMPPPSSPLRMSTPQQAISPSTRLLLNQKRRMRQQRTMVAWLVVAVMGLAILALVMMIRSRVEPEKTGVANEPTMSAEDAALKAKREKEEKEKAEKIEILEGIESLDPAKPKKPAASNGGAE
jgi:predicted nucleic acid-binding Zn ribbon protein